jgi:hypothetical protein
MATHESGILEVAPHERRRGGRSPICVMARPL